MAKQETKQEFPPVTVVTEGEFNGVPTLALPTGNPKRPVIFTLPKWRVIVAHRKEVEAFVEKHKGVAAKAPAPSADAKLAAENAQLRALLAKLMPAT